MSCSLGLTAFCLKLLSLSCFIEECVGDSLVAQTVNNLLQCGRPGFDPWVGKIPWRRKWQPTPVFLPGTSHGRGAWQVQSTGSQSRTWPSTHTCSLQVYYTDHGILQARIMEWVAYLFSSGSSWPRNWTWVFCIAGRFFTNWAMREGFLESSKS